MTPRTRRALVAVLLAAASLLGVIALVRTIDQGHRGDAPIVSDAYIPEQFQHLRLSPGHVDHGDAGVPCRACHALQGLEIRAPKPDVCVGCHDDIATEVHEARKGAARPGCMSCHAFVPDALHPAEVCLRCHGELALTTAAGAPHVGAHATAPCLSCHRQHESAAPAPRDCVDCHEGVASGHGPSTLRAQDRCALCHRLHEGAAEAATRCATCHAEGQRALDPVKALIPGHTLCTSCHADHAFTRQAATPCAACHDAVRVVASPDARPHRDCASCHDPHDVRRASTRCADCHKTIQHDHPAPAGRCVSCHDPHDTGPPVSCDPCHQAQITPRRAHASDVPCTDCHRPHRFIQDKDAHGRCGGCHATQRREAAAASTPDHARCLSCHEGAAHTPWADPTPCPVCHKPQLDSAPLGHYQCENCHVTHSGALKPASSCKNASCHVPTAHKGHGKYLPCANCHRPHGPSGMPASPTCGACHTRSTLPGLHATPEHQRCGACHQAHEPAPDASRAACIACHKDRARHEPAARRCSGCHVFKK